MRGLPYAGTASFCGVQATRRRFFCRASARPSPATSPRTTPQFNPMTAEGSPQVPGALAAPAPKPLCYWAAGLHRTLWKAPMSTRP